MALFMASGHGFEENILLPALESRPNMAFWSPPSLGIGTHDQTKTQPQQPTTTTTSTYQTLSIEMIVYDTDVLCYCRYYIQHHHQWFAEI